MDLKIIYKTKKKICSDLQKNWIVSVLDRKLILDFFIILNLFLKYIL